MSARHAVYWVPGERHPLWRAGCDWLGRDPAASVPPPPAPPHRASPWRYGFHATVKAPMMLRPGVDESEWAAAIAALALRHGGARMPGLEIDWRHDFMALCPTEPPPAELTAMAADVVTELDGFRTPLSAEERARRIEGLDAEGIRLLDRWGYSQVLARWRPHLTLSDDVPAANAALRQAITQDAGGHFAAALARPPGAGDLAWFREPARGHPFELVRRFPLGGPRATVPGSERLIVVVGPSGAGKDSVLRAWRAGLPPALAPLPVRRVVTRAADPDGEGHEPADAASFDHLRRTGQLAFWWSAHGLHYGVRRSALEPLAAGRWVVMNGSREHLPELLSRAPGAHVVEVTAPAAVLAARLAARRREGPAAVAERLSRQVSAAPASLVLSNTGDLADAAARLDRWWRSLGLQGA